METILINPLQWKKRIVSVLLLTFISVFSFAQVDPTDSLPDDPGGISVYTIQNMSFGAFSAGGAGGTIIIYNDGTRGVTGDVVALNLGIPYYQSIFDIDAPLGAIVSILNGSDVSLTGSNGGSMSMHIGNSDPASPFIITTPQPVRTQVKIGGTLTIGSPVVNPPGTYTGTFYITFNLE